MPKCSDCDKVFELKRYLTKHVQRCHGANSKPKEDPVGGLQCSVCDKTFPRLSHLQRHQSTHFNVREFQCKVCKEDFNQKAHLNRHMLRKHENEYLEQAGTSAVVYTSCPTCGVLFKTAYEMQYHRKTTHYPTKCHICKEMVTGIEARKKHEMKCRNESEVCMKCGATFHRMADLRSHENSCLQQEQFQCLHCDSLFRQRVQFDRHFKKAHFKAEKCSVCETVMESPVMKSRHSKECEDKEICGFCGLENPGYFHISKKHWIRLKKAVKTGSTPPPPPSAPPCDITPTTSEVPTKTPVKNESVESETSVVGIKEEAEKMMSDEEPVDPFYNDVGDLSKSSWGIEEAEEQQEIMISFEIVPQPGAQKFEFKGKVPKELAEMFPELEETALVLLDDAPEGGKMNVQVPVTIREDIDAEHLKMWTDSVVKIN